MENSPKSYEKILQKLKDTSILLETVFNVIPDIIGVQGQSKTYHSLQ